MDQREQDVGANRTLERTVAGRRRVLLGEHPNDPAADRRDVCWRIAQSGASRRRGVGDRFGSGTALRRVIALATERSSVSDPFGVGAGDRLCLRPALGRWAGPRLLRTRFRASDERSRDCSLSSIAAAIDLGTQTLRSRERQVAADGRQRLQSPSRGLRELTHSGTDRRLLVIGLPASNGVKPVATGEHGGHRAETWMPRRAGPVESPTRCPYDNEGRSASAVESRPSVAAPRLKRSRQRGGRFALAGAQRPRSARRLFRHGWSSPSTSAARC